MSLVPLPVGFHLQYNVRCPGCGGNLYFLAFGNEFERDVYCPIEACEQHGHEYTIRLGLSNVEVIAVK